MTAWPCCPCWTPRSGASTPELVRLWGSEPRVQRLLTIPGIGPFLAILLVLELGDVQRFPSAKHLASYIGLTPRIRASADRVRSGHISKEGNRLRRWALVLARDPGRAPPRPVARVVLRHAASQGQEDCPRGVGPMLGRDRLSRLERPVEYWTVLRRDVVRG